MKPNFAIIGCGKLGFTLGKHLFQLGYKPKGLYSQSLSSAQELANTLKCKNFDNKDPWEITRDADIIFITSPDGVISSLCEQISMQNGFHEKSIVMHCSGAHPSTILSSAEKKGAYIASMHPLQSFASKNIKDNPFKGIIMSVEGNKKAVSTGKDIATDLGATCIEIKTEAKTFYHASAVVASNYLVALVGFAFKLINEAGVGESDAYKVLSPLIQGTLKNIENAGTINALTGPISRGDSNTINDHIKEIKNKTPDLLDLYKILGLHTLNIAKQKGLNMESVDKLNELFSCH